MRLSGSTPLLIFAEGSRVVYDLLDQHDQHGGVVAFQSSAGSAERESGLERSEPSERSERSAGRARMEGKRRVVYGGTLVLPA